MTLLIKGAWIIDVEKMKMFKGYLVIDGKIIREVGRKNPNVAIEKSCDEAIDGQGLCLAPAFIDIQSNGSFGNDFTNSRGWIYNASAIFQLCKNGLAYIVPTIITGSRDQTMKAIEKIAEAKKISPLDKIIAGIHLEGPYISKEAGPRGCHDLNHIRQPDITEYEEWRRIVGPEFPLIITLAPELPGSESYMNGVKERDKKDGGVTLFSSGHSSAKNVKNTRRFLSLGTHLFNAYYSKLDKHDLGWPGQVICDPDLWATFIPCPWHFRDRNILMIAIGKKGVKKSILITDSTPSAGLANGKHKFGDQDVWIEENAAWLINKGQDDPEAKRLAGSTLFIDQAVANAVNIFDFSLAEAVRMVSFNPAQLLRLDQEIGSLKSGKKASLVLFQLKGQQLVVRLTMLEGKILYRHPLV